MPNFKLKQTSEQVQKAIDNALYPDKELTKEGVPADSKSVGIEIKKNSIHIGTEAPTSGETVWIDTVNVSVKYRDPKTGMFAEIQSGGSTAEAAVKAHNESEDAHEDIRKALNLAAEAAENALKTAQAAQPAGDYPTREELPGLIEEILSGEGDAFSETGEVVELAVEEGTPLSVISKIHRDSTWDLSDKLVLHQVSGSNFVDFSAYFGGAGTVITKSGLTATVNADSTVTITGTNELGGWNYILDKSFWSGVQSEKVYPAGTYTIPSGFILIVRAAQHPSNVNITGATGNLSGTVTIPESFRIVQIRYAVKANTTVDLTLPLGMFRGEAVPETGFAYNGYMHTVTFDRQVYEGEFNWSTGELKDADGNTVAYYDSHDIVSLPGANYFWTGFGENTVSNVPKNLEKVVIQLNETAPEETVSSICDFQLRPTTPPTFYSLDSGKVYPNGGEFFGHEIPLITTKGVLEVVDANGEVVTGKYVDAIISHRGTSDTMTNKGIRKVWSNKFYFTKEPVAQEDFSYDNNQTNSLYTFEFTEEDFLNTGLPAKLDNIPIVSPCFYTGEDAPNKLTQRVYGAGIFPATLSWDESSQKYIFKVRGYKSGYIMDQLQRYTKAYLHYQLETPYDIAATFAMGVSSGDKVTFTVDDSDWKTYAEAELYSSTVADGFDATPSVAVQVPRNTTDACDGMINAARMLNMDETAGGDATVQGYSWIGVGDGATDYTAKIQGKIEELHTVSNGGTIHLGSGTYPISQSLVLYNNVRIIGDGRTVIEQRADNTHAVIWNGSNIRMCDLTIKLAGACTELTACIFANSYNTENGERDVRYPENTYVNNCSTSNVTLVGTYGFSRDDEGYSYLSEDVLAYRGVGVYGRAMYFNYYDCDGLTCKGLYAGISGVGSANIYRVYVTNTRFPVRAGGSNNLYSLIAHSYHADGRDGIIIGSEYAFYGERCQAANIEVRFYDSQFSKGVIYFDGLSNRNYFEAYSADAGIVTGNNTYWETGHRQVTDYGRGNVNRNAFKECYTGIGASLQNLQGVPIWNTQFNPCIGNALSGAGIWGNITSNKEWTSNGIGLTDVCRYPKETLKTYQGLASAVCESSPSEESPIEIIIDISNRPVTNHNSFWVQFDYRYIAEDYTVSFDTKNDGVFDHIAGQVIENNEAVSYSLSYQYPAVMIYRVKISITKALQIPEFTYMDEGFNQYTIDYNPEGKIGIVNIGMPSNEAYGRAFLGECGGSLYGNVDMHQNTLKNLPAPREDGDAVSKVYLERRLAELEESNENGASGGLNITYDGDNESDAHTWVAVANGARHLVKVSNIPNGEIDLIGAEVRVLIPEWPHMNYTFTITSEMYSEVSGLTQILYQDTASNDRSPVAMIVICTKAGKYDIALNGWTEPLQFYEPGIYFMDSRANGGGKYVESLFRSGTDVPEETEENPAEYNGNEIQVFTRGLCIGDSITEGVFNYSGGQTIIKKYSYPSVLKRLTGIDIVNAGVSGLTSKTWYEASINSDTQYGTWVNGEWVWHMSPETAEGDVVSKSLDYSGFDFSVIHLGINDIYTMGEATLDETVLTFEANIYNIINELKAKNTGIKVFLATIIPSYAYPGNTDYAAINEKIREIANATENVFLIDLNAYSACLGGTPYHNIHLTALGYNKMATEIKSLICYTIKEDLEKFKDVQFIGTDCVI